MNQQDSLAGWVSFRMVALVWMVVLVWIVVLVWMVALVWIVVLLGIKFYTTQKDGCVGWKMEDIQCNT